ncbi:hypothetical protein [Micromonospora luteifusca]|uniref:hypothetical protein n=1 Tax=Micromonospora luteifusca TaxID=709860 RepID=UPI0033AC698C
MAAEHPGGQRRGVQVAFAGMKLLPFSMLPDVIRAAESTAAVRYGFGLLPAVAMLAALLLQRRCCNAATPWT